jgi:hypothetical protein
LSSLAMPRLPLPSPCIHGRISCRLAWSLLLQLASALPFPQPRRSLLSPTSPALLPLPATVSLWCFLPARAKFPCSLALGPCSTVPCCFSARVKFPHRVRLGRKPVRPHHVHEAVVELAVEHKLKPAVGPMMSDSHSRPVLFSFGRAYSSRWNQCHRSLSSFSRHLLLLLHESLLSA